MPAIENSVHTFIPTPVPTAALPAPPASVGTPHTEKRGFSFDDFLDVINPLQHLPGVGILYRKLTNDTIGTAEKIAGDTLYGGVMGLASSVADAAFESATGKSFGDTVLALFDRSDSAKPLNLQELPVQQLALSNATPQLAVERDTYPAGRPVPTPEQTTAALNRAQIETARAARAAYANYAYGRAGDLTQLARTN